MSYLAIAVEETPRYDGAPSTSPYRVSTNVFYLPITAARITPDPQWLDRGDELRNIEGVVPNLLDGFEPKGSIAERCYLNSLVALLTAAGWTGTVTPGDGVNEVQRVTITGSPTGGTFTLTFNAQTTAAIPYNATAAQVQAALEALSSIGAGNVVCSGGPLPGSAVDVTFRGALGSQNVALMSSTSNLTGGTSPTVTVTEQTAGAAPTVQDMDGAGGQRVALGAYKWDFVKRTGSQAKSLQVTAGYVPQAVFLRGQGYGVSQLELNAAGELSAELLGLVCKRIADPSLTPSYDTSAIPPVRRGDLKLTWLTGTAVSDDFSLQIANPIAAVKTLESAGFYPNVLEQGDTPVLITGSIPKRELKATDFDALVAATSFAARAKWDTGTRIGTSPTTYKLFIDMPAAQYTEGELDELGNRRRFGASFNWRAGWDETSGYDAKLQLICATSAVETYA